MEIFKLFGSIFVNTDAADASMKKTEKNAESIASKLGAGIKTAGKWGAGIVTAAAAATTAVVGLATNVAETAGDIDDASKKVGATAEEYQKWVYAAKLGGMEASTLESAMIKQQKAFSDAKEGAKTASEAYQRLGIDINSIGNSGDAFNQVMAALADMEDATTRNAIANDIFGKSYAELAPLLAEGSAGIEALKQEAVDLGGVMSNESVEAGAQMGDNIDKLKTSLAGLGNQLGSAVIPIVNTFLTEIIKYMPMIQQMMNSFAPLMQGFLSQIIPLLMNIVSAIMPVIFELLTALMPVFMELANAILPVITELINILLPPIMEIVQAVLPVLMTIITALTPVLSLLAELLTPIIQMVADLIVPLVELIATAITPLIELLGEMLETILTPLIPIIEAVSKVLLDALLVSFENLKPVIDSILQVFTGLINFITGVFSGDWEKAWNAVVEIFSGIFSGIVEMVKWPLNQIITGINNTFAALGDIEIPDWVPVVGGTTFTLPQIPLLWKGGNVVDSGTVIVGEKGPELLNLPQGARVTPLNGHSELPTLDYQILMQIIVEAIREVIPELEQVIQIVPDEDGIFKIVRKKNLENVKAGKPGVT